MEVWNFHYCQSLALLFCLIYAVGFVARKKDALAIKEDKMDFKQRKEEDSGEESIEK